MRCGGSLSARVVSRFLKCVKYFGEPRGALHDPFVAKTGTPQGGARPQAMCALHGGGFFGVRQRAVGCSDTENAATGMSKARDGDLMTRINMGAIRSKKISHTPTPYRREPNSTTRPYIRVTIACARVV